MFVRPRVRMLRCAVTWPERYTRRRSSERRVADDGSARTAGDMGGGLRLRCAVRHGLRRTGRCGNGCRPRIRLVRWRGGRRADCGGRGRRGSRGDGTCAKGGVVSSDVGHRSGVARVGSRLSRQRNVGPRRCTRGWRAGGRRHRQQRREVGAAPANGEECRSGKQDDERHRDQPSPPSSEPRYLDTVVVRVRPHLVSAHVGRRKAYGVPRSSRRASVRSADSARRTQGFASAHEIRCGQRADHP
jgi:hypothetical protein